MAWRSSLQETSRCTRMPPPSVFFHAHHCTRISPRNQPNGELTHDHSAPDGHGGIRAKAEVPPSDSRSAANPPTASTAAHARMTAPTMAQMNWNRSVTATPHNPDEEV